MKPPSLPFLFFTLLPGALGSGEWNYFWFVSDEEVLSFFDSSRINCCSAGFTVFVSVVRIVHTGAWESKQVELAPQRLCYP